MLLSGFVAVCLLGLTEATIVCSAHPKGHPATPKSCNFRGSIRNPKVIAPNPLTYTPEGARSDRSLQNSCRNLCFATQGCKSWSFNYEEFGGPNACTLYSSRISAMKPGKADEQSSTVFSNKGCTAVTLAEGVADSDFEEGNLTYWAKSASDGVDLITAVDATPYGRSGYVASIQAGDGPHRAFLDHLAIAQVVKLCPGTKYNFAVDYYYPSAEQSGSQRFGYFHVDSRNEQGDGPGEPLIVYASQAPDQWQTLSGVFGVPADESYYIRVYMIVDIAENSKVTGIFDNLVITPLADG